MKEKRCLNENAGTESLIRGRGGEIQRQRGSETASERQRQKRAKAVREQRH